MKSTVFFIVALSIFSAYASIQPAIFAELSTTEFGKNMVSFVNLNQNVGVDLNNIKSYLNQFKAQFQKQLTDLTNTYDNKISSLNKQITDTEGNIVTLQGNIAGEKDKASAAGEELNRLGNLIAGYTKTIETNGKKISAGDATDSEKKVAYAKQTKDLEDAIAACKEAIALMNQLNTGASSSAGSAGTAGIFVQVTSKVQQIQQIFLSHKLTSQSSSFGPILEALAQLATRADPESVKNIISLIDQLQKALEAELAQKVQDETVRIANWQSERGDLARAKKTAENSKRVDEISYESEKDKKTAAENLVIQYTNNLDGEKGNLQDFKDKLALEQKRKAKSLKELSGEIDIIDQLIAHFNNSSSKLDNASTYVKGVASV